MPLFKKGWIMKKEQKRFDMFRKPIKPLWYLQIVEWIATPFYMLFNKAHVKTEKKVKKIIVPA